MKQHIKIYFRFFGYDESDFIPCEVCGAKSSDIHHIDCKGMGGDPQKLKDVVENLMALCRECHVKYGDKVQWMDFLQTIHNKLVRLFNTYKN